MAYRLFELAPSPNFGGSKEWQSAKTLFRKRDELMHPKTPSSLEVTDDLWNESYECVTWLMEQFSLMIYCNKRMCEKKLKQLPLERPRGAYPPPPLTIAPQPTPRHLSRHPAPHSAATTTRPTTTIADYNVCANGTLF
jgi:hypothetical protein